MVTGNFFQSVAFGHLLHFKIQSCRFIALQSVTINTSKCDLRQF